MKMSKLLALALVLLISVGTLAGSTIAWFTDSVTSASNVIKSGNLDVEVKYTLDGKSWNDLDGAGDLFQKGLWEPGHTEVVALKISNEGSLALKYSANMNIIEEIIGKTKEGKDIVLSDILTVSTLQQQAMDDKNTENLVGSITLGLAFSGEDKVAYGQPATFKASNVLGTDTQLEPGMAHYQIIKVDMAETVGNEANHNGIDVPSIEFGVNVLATQYTKEEDSFGSDYDKDAEYPEVSNGADTWDGTSDTSWYNDTDSEFVIMTAEQLAGLAELVDGGNTFADKIVKLGKNIDLNYIPEGETESKSFNPIGHSSNGKSFNGTFDGQGYTISNMYMQSNLDSSNGGWQYEGEYYGLFAYTNRATIKNVTVEDAYISSGRNEAAAVVGNAVDTTFEDINIKGTTLIAYNNSAGGVAAECYGDCSFENISVDKDTVIGPLWGTYDVRLGGVVGLVHAGNKVNFKNIDVACKLDAINDVAANYQYWLYRYCGMLIGHVDGVNGVADPTGYVTCENVTVTYGDWVNYHYCEDADLGAGSYNGPGEYKYARVEAGTGTNGIDLSQCNHNPDESHNVLIVFDQLFGGGQGVKGLERYDGVIVKYPA